jgi:hypothetical protein
VIQELVALAERAGLIAVLLPLALGVVVAGMVFLGRSVGEWFHDRNP